MIVGVSLVAIATTFPFAVMGAAPSQSVDVSRGGLAGSAPANVEIPVPTVLKPADRERYRRIFKLQEEGKWAGASKIIKQLDDDILVGHARAQKYLHPTKYRSRYPELHQWLKSHGDHPQAFRIHRLAKKRRVPGWKPTPVPSGGILLGNGANPVSEGPRAYKSPRKRSEATRRAVSSLRSQVRRLVRKGWPTGALRTLDSKRARQLLDPTEFALARADIAHGYFVFGKDAQALKLAERSLSEAVASIPKAAWTAGLAAWRLGKIDKAGEHFQALAAWLEAGPTARAAGAFWASRAHLASRRPREATKWLVQAATVPNTFYGLLARRALGVNMPLDWSLPKLTRGALEELMAIPGFRRGLALLELDMKQEAGREFRRLFPALDDPLRPIVMAIAARHGLPSLSMRVAGVLKAEGHRAYYAALFPIPDWKLPDNLGIDPSLLYAVARRESQFDPLAKSGRGARGLMQLMPRTAAFVGEDRSLRSRKGRNTLFEPAVNIALGDRYIRHLMEDDTVGADLFKLLAAYNAGPGTLRKWEREVNYKDDPLFFIEAIPSPETRNFIEDVLRNLWMYRLRRGEPSPSLDRVASGSWPRYESVEGQVARGYRDARN
jgi:soluble lytic murein transglycosylase-like protein